MEYITASRKFGCLSKSEAKDSISSATKEAETNAESESRDENTAIGQSVIDAIASYRKLKESKKELTDKEKILLEQECKKIEERETIDVDPIHEPVEIELKGKGKIQTGPPTLTRFEKARIMGARALQLSLGAPPFIEIPENATTSLDIAMKELELRVIPITIRRTLPNGDYQNIPIDYFN